MTTTAERLVALMALLLRHPTRRFTAHTLAGLLGCSRRTVYRYVRLLRAAGLVRGGGRSGFRLPWQLTRGRCWT